MSIESTQKFNQIVKKVEFFPFEWSANLIAVCLNDSVEIFKYIETRKDEISDQQDSKDEQSKLSHIVTFPFQQKIDLFSWNPKSIITSLKPVISFAVTDSAQKVIFCTSTDQQNDQQDEQKVQNSTDFHVDCIYNMSFDYQSGEYLAVTGDNSLFLWDCNESKLRAKFLLQSPGMSVCWHRDEPNKFMVAEASGIIRIYSLDTLRPVYSLLSFNDTTKRINTPILSFDWSQLSPEIIIANTSNEILVWNSSKSSLPERILDNFDRLRKSKLCHSKDNLVGFIDGNDACSKFKILNYKSNQTIYQSKNLKLLNSFSFNSVLPIVAISSEQQITIKKVVG